MLKLNGVTRKFDKLTAVDKVNLEIPEGLIFGLLGPNGAGKTTLLRMIMGLISPTSGTITLFDNHSPTDRMVRGRIGYMPQQLAVYPGLSTLENILFYGRLYGVPEEELKSRAVEILDMVELGPQKNNLVANLSGGLVRRTMLATALIHQPSLVILDEPTAGVDPALRIRFWEWFGVLSGKGISILITTHHITEAGRCDQVVFLREGRLIEQGAPDALMRRYHSNDLEEAFVRATRDRDTGV